MTFEKKLLSLDSALIPSGWSVVNLERCLEKIIDYRGKTPEKSDYGILTLSAKSVKMAEIDYSKAYFVSKKTYDKFMVRGFPKKGDILLTTEAPLGCVAKLDRDDICIAQRLIALRGKEGVLDNEYMRFFLTSRIGQAELLNRASGSTVQGIKRSEFSKVNILLPPSIEEQKEIGNILSSLEEKITLNRQINQTLEAMAQALFKSWFVDFEPVKAKMSALAVGGSADDASLAAMSAISGKTTEQLLTLKTTHPDQFQQLVTTADLFPSEMVECEFGEIPKGWAVGTVGDIASFANGRISTGELNQNNYISTENMLANKEGISSASSLPEIETTPSFQNGQILISNIRPYFKKIWLASFNGGRSGDVLAFDAKNKAQKEFLYNLFYQDSFFDYMMLTSKGAKMPRGDKTAIMNYKIAIPNKNMAEIYSYKVSEFYTQVNVLKKQNLVLSELRDALLPKLLAGELLVDGVSDE